MTKQDSPCATCGGSGYILLGPRGLEDYGVEPEREECDDCNTRDCAICGEPSDELNTDRACPDCVEEEAGEAVVTSDAATHEEMSAYREELKRKADEGFPTGWVCVSCRLLWWPIERPLEAASHAQETGHAISIGAQPLRAL